MVERIKGKRRAQQAEVELAGTGNSDRQLEAHILVRIQGLSMAEAGRRLGGIRRQSVASLLKKYDRAVAKATDEVQEEQPEAVYQVEGFYEVEEAVTGA